MATVSPSNFKFVNASGDDGVVKSLTDADIALLNNCLQDVENLKYAAITSLPSGTMLHYAGNVVPEGFLVCNGAAVSRVTYANLFEAIGTLYGAGDGSTTFNLPDARNRVLQGASSTYAVGTSIAAGLPNISGSTVYTMITTTGTIVPPDDSRFVAFTAPNAHVANASPIEASTQRVQTAFIFDASRSSSYYGTTSKPQVDALSNYILIKI